MEATRTCSDPTCDRSGRLTRGMCDKHYARWRYNTPPEQRGAPPRSARRFEDFIDRQSSPTGCWLWTGPVNRQGYGFWSSPGERGLAHRLSLARSNPPADPTLFACHHCDNPPCINPEHLYWGTAADNARDAVERGLAYRPPVSEVCPQGHELVGDNLRIYNGKRFCRPCMNTRAREYQRRKREERSRGSR